MTNARSKGFNKLRLGRNPTADQIEDAVRLLDSGALDEILQRAAPPVDRAVVPQRYADIKPFSHDDWKRRHRVKD